MLFLPKKRFMNSTIMINLGYENNKMKLNLIYLVFTVISYQLFVSERFFQLFGLIWFDGISSILNRIMPNPFYTYIK